MNYYERDEWPAFLDAIRAAQDDDLPRLVAADFVEENGDAERAEFIRMQVEHHRLTTDGRHHCYHDLTRPKSCPVCVVQTRGTELLALNGHQWAGKGVIHVPLGARPLWNNETGEDPRPVYEWHRGFVTRVSATLAVLHGGACLRCSPRRRMARQIEHSEGEALGYPARGLADDLMALYDPCPNCVDGRAPGVLGELLRREPITAAGIEVTDKEPWPGNAGGLRYWSWVDAMGESANPSHYLPASLFQHLEWCPGDIWRNATVKAYQSEAAARLALSEALYRLHGPKSEVLT